MQEPPFARDAGTGFAGTRSRYRWSPRLCTMLAQRLSSPEQQVDHDYAKLHHRLRSCSGLTKAQEVIDGNKRRSWQCLLNRGPETLGCAHVQTIHFHSRSRRAGQVAIVRSQVSQGQEVGGGGYGANFLV